MTPREQSTAHKEGGYSLGEDGDVYGCENIGRARSGGSQPSVDGGNRPSSNVGSEDFLPETENASVVAAFREARLQAQNLSKKTGSSKDLSEDAKSLETSLKRLETQVMRDRQNIMRKNKEQKKDTGMLQHNLKMAREQMQATMVQAADDVIILTQKLQDVEEQLGQCRVVKEHLEKQFGEEVEILKRNVEEMEEQLSSRSEAVRDAQRQCKETEAQLQEATLALQASQGEVTILEQRLQAASEEISELRVDKVGLERQVMTLEGDVSLERANVKNEVQRNEIEKDRHNARIAGLQSQLEDARQDATALEELRAECADLRKKLEAADLKLQECEKSNSAAVQHAEERIKRERDEAVEKLSSQVAELQKQLCAVQEEQATAATRMQITNDRLQSDLDKSNTLLKEVSQQRLDAQAKMAKDINAMMSQVTEAQQEAAKKASETYALKERLMKENEEFQAKIAALRDEGMSTKLTSQEAELKIRELQPQLARLAEEKGVLEQRVGELEAEQASLRSAADHTALDAELAERARALLAAQAEAAHAIEREQRASEELARARKAGQEWQARAESLETQLPKLAAERKVFHDTVHALMAQLTRSRLDKIAALRGQDGPATPREQMAQLQELLASAKVPPPPPPPPPLRTNRTRRVLHLVLIGHAASFTS